MPSLHQTLRCVLCLLALAVTVHIHAAPTATSQPGFDRKFGIHELPLRFVSADYVIQECGWYKSDFNPTTPRPLVSVKAADIPRLPEGVDRVYAFEGENKLVLFSTPEGFDTVEAIVKGVDVPQRQRRLSIRVSVVRVNTIDLDHTGINLGLVPLTLDPLSTQAAAGDSTQRHTFSLFARGMPASELYGQVVRATKNRPTTVSLQVAEDDPVFFSDGVLLGMQMTPYINADDTVTLTLNPPPSGPVQEDVHGLPVPSQLLIIRRTVYNSETMVVSSSMESAGTRFRSKGTNDTVLLIFITPTIVDVKTAPIGTSLPAPTPH